MQQAQELALGVTTYHVGPGFRAGLEQRIRSGEGAPEAICRDPVPLATKLRYVASGAAAAAAVLVAANFLLGEPAPAEPVNAPGSTASAVVSAEPPVANTEEVASPAVAASVLPESPSPVTAGGTPAPSQGLRPRAPRPQGGLPPIAGSWVPMNEQTLAMTTASECVRTADELRYRLRMAQEHRYPAQQAWHNVQSQVVQLRGTIDIMRWLEHREILVLSTPIRRELSEADALLGKALNASSWEDRQRMLHELMQHVQFDKLQARDRNTRLRILCCRQPRDLAGEFKELVERLPVARKVFVAVWSNPTDPIDLDDNTQHGLWIQAEHR